MRILKENEGKLKNSENKIRFKSKDQGLKPARKVQYRIKSTDFNSINNKSFESNNHDHYCTDNLQLSIRNSRQLTAASLNSIPSPTSIDKSEDKDNSISIINEMDYYDFNFNKLKKDTFPQKDFLSRLIKNRENRLFNYSKLLGVISNSLVEMQSILDSNQNLFLKEKVKDDIKLLDRNEFERKKSDLANDKKIKFNSSRKKKINIIENIFMETIEEKINDSCNLSECSSNQEKNIVISQQKENDYTAKNSEIKYIDLLNCNNSRNQFNNSNQSDKTIVDTNYTSDNIGKNISNYKK